MFRVLGPDVWFRCPASPLVSSLFFLCDNQENRQKLLPILDPGYPDQMPDRTMQHTQQDFTVAVKIDSSIHKAGGIFESEVSIKTEPTQSA